jgi:UDP-glucuronate 4-epimerase
MRFLVTGGAGFIGSSLADNLLLQGHEVVCLDNFDNFYDPEIKKENVSNALTYSTYRLIDGDIRDKQLLQSVFSENKIDMVIHLAARAGVLPSVQNPELYYDVNVMGTLYLLECMQKANVKKLIFASSSSVYGNNKNVPFSENMVVDYPISPYAASKKAGELLCHTFHHIHGFDIFCLRFFTVYGPRQRPEMAIHNFVNSIIQGLPIMQFGDGNSQRDYTYIDDIIAGVKGAIKNLKGYEIINIGESQAISLKDLISIIESAVGGKAIIRTVPQQVGDVKITYADITKAKKMLGYAPTFPIVKGIELFVEWYKRNLQ